MASSRDDTAVLLLAALLILGVLGGGFFFIVQRARSMRAMAEEQRARAMQMESQVRAQAAAAEAESQRGGDATLKEALDRAAANLDKGAMKDDPAAAASVHTGLAESYLSINELDAAEKHFKAALELHIKALGENDPQVATDRENLARIAQLRGK